MSALTNVQVPNCSITRYAGSVLSLRQKVQDLLVLVLYNEYKDFGIKFS